MFQCRRALVDFGHCHEALGYNEIGKERKIEKKKEREREKKTRAE